MRSAVLALLVLACRNEPADRAADRVRDQQHALKEVSRADAEFHARRDARIAELEAELAAIAAQPRLIQVLAAALPLTDAGRASLDDKLHLVQVRLDESANLIEALRHTEVDLWSQREAQVAAAMSHLEEARAAAWHALGSAPRAPTSS